MSDDLESALRATAGLATDSPSLCSPRLHSDGLPHTKIVATIGPASEPHLDAMVRAGMSVARVNFSHGTPDEHRRRVAALHAAAARCGRRVAVLVDIQGPKLRLGRVPTGRRHLEAGEVYLLREGAGVAAEGEILLDFPGFTAAVAAGQRVFLADGAVEVVIEEKGEDGARGRVRRGGWIGDRKGIHLPDSALELEVPTPQDRRDLELARELAVDFVGVSFVARAAELRGVRELVPGAQIVAKIERVAALKNLDEILAETDGVMVARGDLGVELELEQLPMVQKSLLRAAGKAGRFTITATEMLESMIEASRPTRAEVADVANAVLDGTDAVMLSAETAVGQYPVEAVAAMARIARAVEASPNYLDLPRVAFRATEPTSSNAVALAAVHAADALRLTRIVCFTGSGRTARLLSRYRPLADIIALSPSEGALRRMAVLAHVRPVPFAVQPDFETMLEEASHVLLENGLVCKGELVVVVAGLPIGVAGAANAMKLHRIGDPTRSA